MRLKSTNQFLFPEGRKPTMNFPEGKWQESYIGEPIRKDTDMKAL